MARAKPVEEPERREPGTPALQGVPASLVAEGSRAVRPDEVREGRRRVVIEHVTPEIEGGRYPAKRVVGEDVVVEADVFADGHDRLAAELRWRREGEREWHDEPMAFVDNDRWQGTFRVEELGRYRYTLRAWVDRFGTWRAGLEKKVGAGQDVSVEVLAGADLVEHAAQRAAGEDRRTLRRAAKSMREGSDPDLLTALLGTGRQAARAAAVEAALDPAVAEAMDRSPDRRTATAFDRELAVWVEPERARFSAWYEMFPRSTGRGTEPGTFATTEQRLPYVAGLGFDILYLPPIHPIGRTLRKGPNNDPSGGPGVVGSPWAIGGEEGGHTAIHPDLGTFGEFDRLVAAAAAQGIQIALDIAFQCSPDHPWVREHPDWFRKRADGSIQYAENPPKKYEDIYPLDFGTEDWRGLWAALRDVFVFWIAHGVRVFRVDNPHTKSLAFWEWCIDSLKREHPDLIFLSEAFTRPRLMERLAKLGFTQSYTYFAWRTTKREITEYMTELTQTELREYFRPNFWPNTPDILTEQMQTGGRATFIHRLVLAATLSSSYGIYGPAFELQEHEPVAHGREEYDHSEKYEIRDWNLENPRSLAKLVGRVNAIRRENPALHSMDGFRFHHIDNDNMLIYSKATADRSNAVLVVVNLDPYAKQAGWTHLWLDDLGVTEHDRPFQVHDLLTDARFVWRGSGNFVELDPQKIPAHVFRIRRRVRDERDFATYQ
ncbi:MAG TPA: alpha-1,4-glucan--maltose-1-phosphate maltosyltransferase [Actinomycetota bacterium]